MKLSTSVARSALGLQALFAGLAVAQASGKFDVLTYNVAGLPAVINGNDEPGDKTTNARLIGAAMAKERFDIVHMQEDFNYHAYIYSTDTHPVRTPTSGGVPFGDGLNTLSNYNYTKFTRTTWKRCSLNSGDCLTPKGFSFMVIPTIGFELHLYNLHSDAGDSDSDVASRSSDVDQVLAAINAQSQGVPVIVAGDTNDRYTNAGVSITKFSQAGFKDPWVDLIKNGVYPAKGATADPCPNPAPNNECEIVDKVLYRSGDSVTLTATSFNYVPQDFLQSNGSVLSDHNPVLVNFDWVKK